MTLNIEQVRKKENVSLVDMADLIGVKSQTVSDKIKGDYDFKFGEARKIKETFFPSYDIVWLFSENSTSETA